MILFVFLLFLPTVFSFFPCKDSYQPSLSNSYFSNSSSDFQFFKDEISRSIKGRYFNTFNRRMNFHPNCLFAFNYEFIQTGCPKRPVCGESHFLIVRHNFLNKIVLCYYTTPFIKETDSQLEFLIKTLNYEMSRTHPTKDLYINAGPESFGEVGLVSKTNRFVTFPFCSSLLDSNDLPSIVSYAVKDTTVRLTYPSDNAVSCDYTTEDFDESFFYFQQCATVNTSSDIPTFPTYVVNTKIYKYRINSHLVTNSSISCFMDPMCRPKIAYRPVTFTVYDIPIVTESIIDDVGHTISHIFSILFEYLSVLFSNILEKLLGHSFIIFIIENILLFTIFLLILVVKLPFTNSLLIALVLVFACDMLKLFFDASLEGSNSQDG